MNPKETEVEVTKKQGAPIRMGTIVWGLVIVALGVLLILWNQGLAIQPQTAAIVLLLGAGVLLILGSLITALRGSRQDERDHTRQRD